MFPVSLGGKTWDIPSLPWRICREAQPKLVDFADRARADGSILAIPPEKLDALADVAFAAIRHAEPELSREDFDNLAFSVSDLCRTFDPLARAIGLLKADAEAPPGGGPIPTSGGAPEGK